MNVTDILLALIIALQLYTLVKVNKMAVDQAALDAALNSLAAAEAANATAAAAEATNTAALDAAVQQMIAKIPAGADFTLELQTVNAALANSQASATSLAAAAASVTDAAGKVQAALAAGQ